MRNRYWMWVGVRLLVGVALVAWAVSYLRSGGDEKEFQKALDAMKKLQTFRATSSGNLTATRHADLLWEVDCKHSVVHFQSRLVESALNPPVEIDRDEVHVGNMEYERKQDGSWSSGDVGYQQRSAKQYCNALAKGADTRLLPDVAAMIQHAVLQKGDTKTVNGVQCQEWTVTTKTATSDLEHNTICLGLEDHLPYESSTNQSRIYFLFSDFNAPLQIEMPEAAAKRVSAGDESH